MKTKLHAPRFIILGGFLGAGKTTIMLKLAQEMKKRGGKIAVITNDQAMGLVDTALMEHHHLLAREITGGCLCCNIDRLVAEVRALSDEFKPDIFLAEPVGSCTDLMATVALPLERVYQCPLTVAPLAVVVDPFRALQSLSNGSAAFTEDVIYIYRKQLEEARIIAINKIDVLPATALRRLRRILAAEFPEARLYEVSARDGTGIKALSDALSKDQEHRAKGMSVDYARYASGEEKLGWFNAELQVSSPRGVSGVRSQQANDWLGRLAGEIHSSLRARNCEIAHLKVLLKTNRKSKDRKKRTDVAVLNAVNSSTGPAFANRLSASVAKGTVFINLRAEAAPQALREAVAEAIALAGPALTVSVVQEQAFRPGAPNPPHRLEL